MQIKWTKMTQTTTNTTILFKVFVSLVIALHSVSGYCWDVLDNDKFTCNNNQTCNGRPHSSCLQQQVSIYIFLVFIELHRENAIYAWNFSKKRLFYWLSRIFYCCWMLLIHSSCIHCNFIDCYARSPFIRKIVTIWIWCACWHWALTIETCCSMVIMDWEIVSLSN